MFDRRLTLVFVLILTLALGGVALAQTPSVPVSDNGITPVLVDGNPSCIGLGYDYGFKPDVDGDEGFIGTYTFNFPGDVVNTVTVTSDGTYVDWESTLGIEAVILKGGPDANLYIYLPPALSFGDGGLAAPLNPNTGQPYGFSHVEFCYTPVEDFEALDVSKTVVTSYTREHSWDIAKSVETEYGYELDGYPKIWLYIDGSGDETATWTVDVTYQGYEDSDWNVTGVITIENTGTLPAVITAITDTLSSEEIPVYCGEGFELPYTLPVGETLMCSYDEDGYFEGENVATVTTEQDTYSATEPIVWGDPTTEINATVNVQDISDLFGTVDLGMVMAPNDAQFTYTKDFAWADYGADGCGSFMYDNTATIVETGQEVSATLKVNVQCYVYETAYAKGDGAICFIPTFRNWGWTNPITPGIYEMELWAAAGQCDTSKGTLVGTVTVEYDDDGYVTVTYNVAAPYLLDETHVYAGTTMFPLDRRGRPTVAPGLYYNASPFTGDPLPQVYVIAHAVVGIPDPNFGP